MCPATPTKNQSRGYIVPIGGAEAKHKDPVILERFITLCGGQDARILVIPTASLLDETGPLYQELFEGMGAKAMCIPIEERDSGEVTDIEGQVADRDEPVSVRLVPPGSPAANYAFDVTPARLVTGLITERGVCEASESGILELFPDRKA